MAGAHLWHPPDHQLRQTTWYASTYAAQRLAVEEAHWVPSARLSCTMATLVRWRSAATLNFSAGSPILCSMVAGLCRFWLLWGKSDHLAAGGIEPESVTAALQTLKPEYCVDMTRRRSTSTYTNAQGIIQGFVELATAAQGHGDLREEWLCGGSG